MPSVIMFLSGIFGDFLIIQGTWSCQLLYVFFYEISEHKVLRNDLRNKFAKWKNDIHVCWLLYKNFEFSILHLPPQKKMENGEKFRWKKLGKLRTLWNFHRVFQNLRKLWKNIRYKSIIARWLIFYTFHMRPKLSILHIFHAYIFLGKFIFENKWFFSCFISYHNKLHI